jgi:hypothetical protein
MEKFRFDRVIEGKKIMGIFMDLRDVIRRIISTI